MCAGVLHNNSTTELQEIEKNDDAEEPKSHVRNPPQ